MSDFAEALPARPWSQRWPVWIFLGAVLLFLVVTWEGAGLRPLDLWKNRQNLAVMLGEFFPPDFSDWREFLRETWVTVQMAFWATTLAVVCAIPLALLASANLSPAWLRFPVRRLLDVARAINEMVFALIFIVAVGPGSFAGVIALAIGTAGTLGKLFAEATEAIDPHPLEGIRATGARPLDVIGYGVIPQVLPQWVSLALYRFEANVRAASVLGIVGAGGIGMVMHDCIRSFEYRKTCAVLIILVAVVAALDALSSRLRRTVR